MIYRELFFVGFFADIALNELSRLPEEKVGAEIKALLPYFEAHCPIVAAIYAGITTAIVGAIAIEIAPLFAFTGPAREIVSAFIVGYIADILIERFKIFGPSLQPFFDTAGAGLWGGLAIAFAVGVVRIGHKSKLLPRL